jgi:hypothetical protein
LIADISASLYLQQRFSAGCASPAELGRCRFSTPIIGLTQFFLLLYEFRDDDTA